jgi:hypothetical protein
MVTRPEFYRSRLRNMLASASCGSAGDGRFIFSPFSHNPRTNLLWQRKTRGMFLQPIIDINGRPRPTLIGLNRCINRLGTFKQFSCFVQRSLSFYSRTDVDRNKNPIELSTRSPSCCCACHYTGSSKQRVQVKLCDEWLRQRTKNEIYTLENSQKQTVDKNIY